MANPATKAFLLSFFFLGKILAVGRFNAFKCSDSESDSQLKWYSELVLSSLRESVTFVLICAAIAVVGLFVLGVPFADGLGLVLLVAGAGLMLVGGALSFVSPGNVWIINALTRSKISPSDEDYRKTRNRAALYSLTGILLFAYSLLLALASI